MHSLKNKCHFNTNKEDINSEYVGIGFNQGSLNIIFPLGYKPSKNDIELRNDVMLLIKAFEKYLKSNRGRAHSRDERNLTTGTGNKFSLSDSIWFLNDYAHNGLYKQYNNRYKTDKKGNINWPRTIKSITPYINKDKLIYLNYIVKEKNNDIENIILLIQKYIIEKCIEIIGWLYPNIQIEGVNKLPYKRSICINLLCKELSSVNNDKTKTLLLRMIDFLENVGDESDINSLKENKINLFEHVWEEMLNSVLGNQDPSLYYPNAVWNIDGFSSKASNLKPDTILKLNNIIYVLDAKYYKYGITKSKSHLPQSSDITKQMIYSSYIETNYSYNSYDVFILPYDSNNKDIFKFVGYAATPIKEFQDKKVMCILADTKSIIKRYLYGNNLDIIKSDIVRIIDENN